MEEDCRLVARRSDVQVGGLSCERDVVSTRRRWYEHPDSFLMEAVSVSPRIGPIAD